MCLGLGGHLTVIKGADLRTILGMPPVVVGMLIVAIGTSLPELVTSVIAALKNESDLCLGNVIGSNLFNSLFVLPISALIRPMPIPDGGIIDILLTLAFSAALLTGFLLRRRDDEPQGSVCHAGDVRGLYDRARIGVNLFQLPVCNNMQDKLRALLFNIKKL